MNQETKRKDNVGTALVIALIIVSVLTLTNSVRLSGLTSNALSGKVIGEGGTRTAVLSDSKVLPTGVPEIYGEEIGVSFDDVSPLNPQLADTTIRKLSNYDRTITLEGSKLQRYIGITSLISCEYCCGAKSIIFSDGQPACGCAHSYAMRGLAKYLVTEHPEMTDSEILEELGKWKVLFFPDIHKQKAAVLEQQGIEINYINLASNKYRGIEQGAAGGSMVGGC